MKLLYPHLVAVCVIGLCAASRAQVAQLPGPAGPLFPIGFYELPADAAALQKMAEAGVNLIRCQNRQDLDRVQAAGALGWVSVPVQEGATESLRTQVLELRDHPALAVWEGPDEIVWVFTAMSTLKDTAGFTREDWMTQQPKAVAYAEGEAARIMPNIIAGVNLIKELDDRDRPFWINEARDSDAHYVRQYLDTVQIVGADDYPVRPANTDLMRLMRGTDRWVKLSRGKPVWMVLQAFSWDEIGRGDSPAWPSFAQSRFMAYGVIAHGADGVLYWGSSYLKNDAFRTSLYALTSELAALQAFLTASEDNSVSVQLLESADAPVCHGVAHFARSAGADQLIVLVNQDDYPHHGVEVSGLTGAPTFKLLYGSEEAQPDAQGSFVTRMQPHEVKVFATDRRFETSRLEGREFK